MQTIHNYSSDHLLLVGPDKSSTCCQKKPRKDELMLFWYAPKLSFRTVNPKLKPRTQILNQNPKETRRKRLKANHWQGIPTTYHTQATIATFARIYAHARSYSAYMHVRTHTCTCALTHTSTHANTHTRTYTRMYTRTRTQQLSPFLEHTLILSISLSLVLPPSLPPSLPYLLLRACARCIFLARSLLPSCTRHSQLKHYTGRKTKKSPGTRQTDSTAAGAYVDVCMYIYTHKHVCVCVSVCECVCVYVFRCVCTYVYIHVYTCAAAMLPTLIYFYVYTYIHMCQCVCVCVCLRFCVCVCTYIYIYICTHICIFESTYIHVFHVYI